MFSLDNLNKEQRGAVESKYPTLITAGPGTGKTLTISYKVIHECEKEDIDITDYLILTFTNEAGEEIRKRITNLYTKPIKNKSEMHIGTFHGIFFKILKKSITYKNHTLIFPSSNLVYVKKAISILKKCQPWESEEHIQEMFSMSIYDFFDIVFSHQINRANVYLDDILEDLEENQLWGREKIEFVSLFLNQYSYLKNEDMVITFSDILKIIYTGLLESESLLDWIQKRFKYILVDEFQDTNIIQFEILKLIAKDGNISAIGDPRQSIYGFLNAEVENINYFLNEFSANHVQLKKNYRSNKNIISLLNEMNSYFSLGIHLDKLESTKTKNSKIEIHKTDNMDDIIVSEIKKDIKKGMTPNEIAIIIRQNKDSAKIEEKLSSLGIEFRKLSGRSFFESIEVVIAISILRFYSNNKDPIYFKDIAQYYFGIGEFTINKILEAFQKGRITSFSYDEIDGLNLHNQRKGKALEMLKVFDDNSEVSFNSYKKIIEDLKIHSGLISRQKRVELREEMQENLDNFVETIGNDFKGDNLESAVKKVNDLSLVKSNKDEHSNSVIITTAHTAKGLEWDKVFLYNISANHWTKSAQDEFLLTKESIRLLYVALSRARNNLVLLGKFTRKKEEQRKIDIIINKLLGKLEDKHFTFFKDGIKVNRDDLEINGPKAKAKKKSANMSKKRLFE
jgi:DNA helicase II / ATP-dependent DNA helicase PcrA